jgi:hypothetical protein
MSRLVNFLLRMWIWSTDESTLTLPFGDPLHCIDADGSNEACFWPTSFEQEDVPAL